MENDRLKYLISDNLKGLYLLISEKMKSVVTDSHILLLDYPYEDILFLNIFDKKTVDAISRDRTLRESFPVVVFMNNNSTLASEIRSGGFMALTRWKGMILSDKPKETEKKGLEFIHVTNPYRYNQWEKVAHAVFHSSEENPKRLPYSKLYRNNNIKFILGLYNKKPACTGAIFDDGRSAGIYFIGTHPDFRGMGLGSALTKHLINCSKRSNIVLQATLDGYKIYSKLGFKEICNFDLYRLMPDEN